MTDFKSLLLIIGAGISVLIVGLVMKDAYTISAGCLTLVLAILFVILTDGFDEKKVKEKSIK